ncbi:MAG: DUF177 domain-containing protein [Rhodobacteraceae bacterium]|nr:DUF177 domain-containing protein [Paracoccaceae bacterium]
MPQKAGACLLAEKSYTTPRSSQNFLPTYRDRALQSNTFSHSAEKMHGFPPMVSKKSEAEQQAVRIRVADLPQGVGQRFDLEFDKKLLAEAKKSLDLLKISKVRIVGDIRPEGRNNWMLTAEVGATITQSCVVSLKPVKTRLDEFAERHFIADWHEPESDTEIEMDNNDTHEPLGEFIDLEQIALEVIVLNMPVYPRAKDALLITGQFSAPGIAPLTDEDVKPFASLAGLKEKLEQ